MLNQTHKSQTLISMGNDNKCPGLRAHVKE